MRLRSAIVDGGRERVGRLVVSVVGILAVYACAGLAHAADPCGEAPPVQFRAADNESIKGDLEGSAKFLSGYVGNAQLGGQITSKKSEIFAKYEDANQARMASYLGYIFCKIIFDENSHLSAQERLNALYEFKSRTASPPQGPAGPAAAPTKSAPDLSGDWDGHGPTDVAEVKKHFQYVYFPPSNMTFHFLPDGDVLQGTLSLRKDDRFYTSSDYEYGLLDGKIDGNRVSFAVHSDFAVNDAPKVAVEHFSGRVDGDQIHFTIQEETGYPPLQFTAIRAAAPQAK